MTMVEGRVSVIIITYNQAHFIRETVGSVQSQTYHDVEIVVADDGSTDDSQVIIRELAAADPRVVPALASQNRGIAANLNQGWRRCTGEFVAYLGGDDLMLPAKLARQVEFLRANRDHVACVHDMEVFDSSTGKRLYLHSERYGMHSGGIELELAPDWTLGLFGKQPKSLPSAQMVRASAMPPHGFDERLPLANDWLHGIEVLRHGKRGYLPEVLGRYRRHSGQVSHQPEVGTKGLEEFLLVLAIVAARYPELASHVKQTRDWLLFQRVLYDYDPAPLRADRARQFRIEAGLGRDLYLRAIRALVRNERLLTLTQPLRRLIRRLRGG